MAEKMSGTELRKLLAARAGVSEKEANAFLNAFNSQLVEALKQEKQVKINGLGIFRLQPVAPRKSVNVKTGEAITIEGYNKLAFAPESGMKELIESAKVVKDKTPKAKQAPGTEEVDPLRKLGEQATEIVDILGELGQSPEKDLEELQKVRKPKKKKEPKIEEPRQEEPKVELPIVPILQKEDKPIKPKSVEPQQEKQEKPKKKYHFLRDTLICVVCLLLVLLIGYFFLRGQLSSWIESLIQPTPTQTEVVASPTVADTMDISNTDVTESDSTAKEQKVEEAADPVYEELITIEPMHEASRLAWMSKRYYGEKKFWVYLYDANRDHIKNPSRILVGTPIRVPKLTAAQKDTTLASTRATLEKLTREAEAACKK